MTAVFKAQGHLFVQHFHDTFDRAYIVSQNLPFGLTQKEGEIAISPHGRILGWRFDGDEKFETWNIDGDIPLGLIASEDYTGGFTSIEGTTKTEDYTNRQWSVCYHVRSGDSYFLDEASIERFDSFKDAIAVMGDCKWDNVVVLEAEEAYQS